MPKISPEIEAFARIKVVGVGGSGSNAITHMISQKVQGVEFVAVNTDAQDLHHTPAPKKIHIGKNVTRGLGTGMSPEIGKKAAEETIEEIQEVLKGADMIFITCGLGGGTGTGASPIIARTAKEQGILTVGVVTKPFYFEGAQRMRIAEEGMEELKKVVDTLIVIPNDRLLAIVDKETTFTNAFAMCDEILRQAVEGISDLITQPGIINVDFADIKSVMQNAGSALMGIGSAVGDNRSVEAAHSAINSPLLDISIDGAQGILFAIAGGDDLTMLEVQEAAKIITESIDKDARVIFGAIQDDKLKKGEIRVTVIATGFPNESFGGNGNTFFGGNTDSKSSPFGSILDSKKKDKEEKNGNKDEQVKPKKEDKKAIFNEMATPNVTTRKMDASKQAVGKKEEKNKEDEDWGSIPAFLRRRK